MECPACGAAIADNAAFCGKCGEKVRSGISTPTSAASNPIESAAEKLRPVGDDVEEERDVWSGGYSGKAMVGTWLIGFVVTAIVIAGGVALSVASVVGAPIVAAIAGGILVILWIYLISTYLYRRWSVHYELTTQRFIHKVGILSRKTDRIEVIDIDDVAFSQGIVERMMGVGSITITSSDRSHPELVLKGIDDVENVANQIDDIRRKERRRRGVHIEAI